MPLTFRTLFLAALVPLAGCAAEATLGEVEPNAPAGAAALADAASAGKFLVNRDKDGLALQGYDTVAYFTDGQPVKGDAAFQSRYHGATWQFASAEHKALFDGDPGRYAAQFGGYCGYAASINKLSPISPDVWEILDGRLVLQHNQRAWDAWHEDVPGNLVKADANWPGLVRKNASAPRSLLALDADGVALGGYDPMAYVLLGAPVRGTPEIIAVYNGATYHFASKTNKDAFELDPSKHEPAFGGFSGWSVALGNVTDADPLLFTVVDERVVLHQNARAKALFERDLQHNVIRATKNWSGLVEKFGR